MPKEKYSYATEIFEHSQRIGEHYGLYDKTHFQTRVRSVDWDDEIKRWHISTNRDDDIKARFVVMALGTATRAKLPGIPGIEEFEGHSLPHQPLGLRLHGRRHHGRHDEARRQARRDHRHRRHRHPVRAPYGPVRQAPLRVPADAVIGRLARQQADRSRVVGDAAARLAARAARELQRPGVRPARRGRSRAATAGPTSSATSSPRRRAPTSRRRREERAQVLEIADFRKMNQIRQRVEDTVRRHRHRRVAEALVPPDLQATDVQRRVPRLLQPGQRHARRRQRRPRAWSASPRRASSPTARSTRSTASSTPRASRSRPSSAGASASRSTAATGCRCSTHWADGLRTLHGFSTRGFPNWFYIGVSQNAFSVNMTAMFDDQARHIAYIIAETRRREGDDGRAHRGGPGRMGRPAQRLPRRRPRLPRDVHARLLQQRGHAAGRQCLLRRLHAGHQRLQRAARGVARGGRDGRHGDRSTDLRGRDEFAARPPSPRARGPRGAPFERSTRWHRTLPRARPAR